MQDYRALGVTKSCATLIVLGQSPLDVARRLPEATFCYRKGREFSVCLLQRWQGSGWATVGVFPFWYELPAAAPVLFQPPDNEPLPPLGPVEPWQRPDRSTTAFGGPQRHLRGTAYHLRRGDTR